MSLSNEDTLRIVKHFLLSSPPGEFEDVLSVNDDELLNQGALDIFRSYNVEQLIPVDVSDKGYKAILCSFGELDTNRYLDPRSNLVLTVNHVKGTVENVEDNDSSPQDEKQRAEVEKVVDSYVTDYYLDGVASVFPQQSGTDYIICICGSKFNEKNFWSGRWRSVWKVSFDGKKVKVSGSVKVNVHYYERGNVQLNTTKEYAETIESKSEDEAVTSIAKVLAKVETTFMKEIDGACNNLSETFKSLRRRLPISKQLFNFASNEHKLATNFK